MSLIYNHLNLQRNLPKKLAKSVLMRKSRPIALYVPPIDSVNTARTSMVARIVLIIVNMAYSNTNAQNVVEVQFASMGSRKPTANYVVEVQFASMGSTRLNANYVVAVGSANMGSKSKVASIALIVASMGSTRKY